MKPHLRLLNGRPHALRQQMEQVVAWIGVQSDAPLHASEYRSQGKVIDRMGAELHARVRRKVIRAYGSLALFGEAGGLRGYEVSHLFKAGAPCTAGSNVAQWRAALGLPVESRLANTRSTGAGGTT